MIPGENKGYSIDRDWLTLQMTPKEYARLIGHSEGYVRKHCIRDPDAETVWIRIPTPDILEDMEDVR